MPDQSLTVSAILEHAVSSKASHQDIAPVVQGSEHMDDVHCDRMLVEAMVVASLARPNLHSCHLILGCFISHD